MRKLIGQSYPDSHARDTLSDISSDSGDSVINPRTANILFNALNVPIDGVRNENLNKLLQIEHLRDACAQYDCQTQYQLQSTDDDKENNVNQDFSLKAAYNRLLLENQKLLKSMAELVAINETLRREKVYISTNLRNLQQQLRLVANSNNALGQRECDRPNVQFCDAYRKLKAESEQRISFCNKKLEEYIVRLHDRESTIDDLKSQLKTRSIKYETQICELRRKLAFKSLKIQFMNKSEGCILQEPSFIDNREMPSSGKKFAEPKFASAEKLIFGDQSSISNLVLDCEADSRFNVLRAYYESRSKRKSVKF